MEGTLVVPDSFPLTRPASQAVLSRRGERHKDVDAASILPGNADDM